VLSLAFYWEFGAQNFVQIYLDLTFSVCRVLLFSRYSVYCLEFWYVLYDCQLCWNIILIIFAQLQPMVLMVSNVNIVRVFSGANSTSLVIVLSPCLDADFSTRFFYWCRTFCCYLLLEIFGKFYAIIVADSASAICILCDEYFGRVLSLSFSAYSKVSLEDLVLWLWSIQALLQQFTEVCLREFGLKWKNCPLKQKSNSSIGSRVIILEG